MDPQALLILAIGFLFIYSGYFKKPVQLKDIGIPAPDKSGERISYMLLGIILILLDSSIFLTLQFPDPGIIVLDSMDSSAGWEIRTENNGTLMSGIQSAMGFKNNAIEMDYDLGVGGAVVISKKIPFNLISKDINKDINKIEKITFNYIAKERLNSTHIVKGDPNSLEIQLDDNERGLCFGHKFSNAASAANWTSAEVQIKDLRCWCASCQGNETINFNKIGNIELAITNLDGEKGGQGEVIIDQIVGVVPASGFPSFRFRP